MTAAALKLSHRGCTALAQFGEKQQQLTVRQAVKATIVYFKTNVAEEVIAELLFVDQATVSRAITELEGMVADVIDEFLPDLAEEN